MRPGDSFPAAGAQRLCRFHNYFGFLFLCTPLQFSVVFCPLKAGHSWLRRLCELAVRASESLCKGRVTKTWYLVFIHSAHSERASLCKQSCRCDTVRFTFPPLNGIWVNFLKCHSPVWRKLIIHHLHSLLLAVSFLGLCSPQLGIMNPFRNPNRSILYDGKACLVWWGLFEY